VTNVDLAASSQSIDTTMENGEPPCPDLVENCHQMFKTCYLSDETSSDVSPSQQSWLDWSVLHLWFLWSLLIYSPIRSIVFICTNLTYVCIYTYTSTYLPICYILYIISSLINCSNLKNCDWHYSVLLAVDKQCRNTPHDAIDKSIINLQHGITVISSDSQLLLLNMAMIDITDRLNPKT